MRKIGSETNFIIFLNFHFNNVPFIKQFPPEFLTTFKEKGHLTIIQNKECANFISIASKWIYNQKTFNISIEPFDIKYTPDIIINNIWVEVKNNCGFYFVGKKLVKINPDIWNHRKKIIRHWCYQNNVQFCEIRWNSAFNTWDDFTNSKSPTVNKKVGKKSIPTKTKKGYIMRNVYERRQPPIDLDLFEIKGDEC